MKLSIIIPNRNDTVMLSVTVRSALEALKSIDNDGEVIVVDNSDEDIWRVLKAGQISPLAVSEPRLRLIRQNFPSMYSARQTGIEASKAEYVVGCDSHTLWGHNVIYDVVKFMDNHPNCGMGFSNIGWIDKPETHAKSELKENSQGGLFGPWGGRLTEEKKITWLFSFRIARRKWFLDTNGHGFFAREKISWGGGEFYIAMKNWMMGSENWYIPTSPVYHIGPFNKRLEGIAKYAFRVYGSSGVGRQGIGILASFYALGGERYGREIALRNEKAFRQYGVQLDRDWEEAKKLAGSDREWICNNCKYTYEDIYERKPWN